MPTSVSEFSTRSLSCYFLSDRARVNPDLTSRLIDFINGTRSTLYVAIYDLRDVEVAAALKHVARAGKSVRIVYDGSQSRAHPRNGVDPKPSGTEQLLTSAGLTSLAKAIKIPGHLMHDKFLVRDGASVWTGSANFTAGGLGLQDNNCLEIHSRSLATLYARAFGLMWSSPGTRTPVSARTSGQTVKVGSAGITVWFEPAAKEGTDQAVVQALSKAKKLRIMAFLMSDPETLTALRRFAPAGKDVRGIYDRQGMLDALGHKAGKPKPPDPVLDWFMKDPRFVEVKSHPFGQAGGGGESDFMHNKAMILDEHLVITGSYNFSENAEANGENMLMIDSSEVAAAYGRYFDTMYRFYKRTGG